MPDFDCLMDERNACCFRCWLKEHWLGVAYILEMIGLHDAAEELVESWKEMQ